MLFRVFSHLNQSKALQALPSETSVVSESSFHSQKEENGERVSRCISGIRGLRLRKASMTVEAALAFPLFLLGITAFLWLFFLVQREVQTGRALTDAAREAAGMAYFAENRSGLEDNTCLLRLQDTYELRLPPGTDWFHPIRITQVRTVRGWVGFQGRQRIVSGDGEELVYVTDYGTVYHRELSCRHLKLSIRQEPLSQIGSLRNTNGAKYYPCELCWAGNGNTAYLTESGNRYHASLSCQGLVRGIHAVPLSQTGGLPPCSACGW